MNEIKTKKTEFDWHRFINEIINRGGFPMTRIEIQKYIKKEWAKENAQERLRVIDAFAWAPQANKVVGNALDGDPYWTAEEVDQMIKGNERIQN